MKEYPPITEEQKDAIRQIIQDADTLTFETRESGHFITANNQYDYVQFDGMSVLTAYMKIAHILGCTDGDEVERECTSEGCETCGYGSNYYLQLHFW